MNTKSEIARPSIILIFLLVIISIPLIISQDLGRQINTNIYNFPLSTSYWTWYAIGNESKWVEDVIFEGDTATIIAKDLKERTYNECILYDKVDEKTGEAPCLKYGEVVYDVPSVMPVKDYSSDKELTTTTKFTDAKSQDVFTVDLAGQTNLKVGDNSIHFILEPQFRVVFEDTEGGVNVTSINISSIYPYDKLVSYYSFDSNISEISKVYDYSNNSYHGTLFRKPNNTLGLYGKAYRFVGGAINNSINISASSKYVAVENQTVTMMAWAYPMSAPYATAGSMKIFTITNSSTITSMAIALGETSKFQYVFNNSAYNFSTALSLNKWSHLAIVYNGSCMQPYLNGATDGNCEAGRLLVGGSPPSVIGRGQAVNGFNGTVDEVMFFNTNLSATDISNIYNNASQRFKSQGNLTYPAIPITEGNNTVNLTVNQQTLYNSNISARIGMINDSLDNLANLTLYIPFEWVGANTTGAGQMTYDISSNHLDTTVQTGIAFNNTGGLNGSGAFELNGDTNPFSAIEGVMGITQFTTNDSYSIGFWEKANSGSVNGEVILHNRCGGSSSGKPYAYGFYILGDAQIVFERSNSTSTGVVTTPASSNVSDYKWHFIFGTYNYTNSNWSIYLDGTIVNSTISVISGDTNYTTFGLCIGYKSYQGSPFNGTLDELRIYNKTLSPDEISAIYGNDSRAEFLISYTPWENLSTSITTFNISNESNYLSPQFKMYSGSSQWYSPLLLYNFTLETFDHLEGQADTEYPLFYNFTDNNASLLGIGTATLSANINSTNGTAGIQFNMTNYSASNLTDFFNTTTSISNPGVYNYFWWSYGNGTNHHFNKSSGRNYTVTVIDLNLTYPNSTNVSSGMTVTQNQMFNITVNVSCLGGNCGDINISLDPVVAIYLPNMTGGNAWNGTATAEPPVSLSGVNVAYTQGNLDNISSDNSDSVSQGGTQGGDDCSALTLTTCNTIPYGDGNQCALYYQGSVRCENGAPEGNCNTGAPCALYATHKIRFKINENTIYNLSIRVRANATVSGSPTGADLYAWNHSSSSFVLISENASCGNSCNLTAQLNPVSSFVNSSGDLYLALQTDTVSSVLSLYYAEANVTAKGLISTVEGATPFYTNASNPNTTSLNDGQSAVIVFWVNATGNPGTYSFFAYANKTSNMFIGNITPKWNVTIVAVASDTTPPYFTGDQPTNQTLEYSLPLNYDINASDDIALSNFSVNDTKFTINSSGYLKNATALGVKIYWLNITINDTTNNLNSTVIYVNITKNITTILTLPVTNPIIYPTATDFTGAGCPSEISCSLNISNGVFGVGTIYANYSTAGNENYSATSVINSTVINKNTTSLGLSATTPITYPTATDFTGTGCNAQISCSLNISNVVYGAGAISANYSTVGNENYSQSSAVFTVTINKNSTNNLGISGTTPITYPTISDFSGTGCPTELTCTMDLVNAIYGAGNTTFNYSTSGDTNYTAMSYIKNLSVIQNTTYILTLPVTSPITYPTDTDFIGVGCPTELTCSLNLTNGNFSVGTRYANYSTSGDTNYSATSIVNSTIIQQNTSSNVNLYINGTRANFTTINSSTTLNLWLNATIIIGEGDIAIIVNGTTYNNGSSPQANLTNLSIGLYNITAYKPDTTNYSSAQEIWWVNITNLTIVDSEYPLFYNYSDNNATLQEFGTANFSVNINSTNGTAGIEFAGINYSASNDTDFFNMTVSVISSGIYHYYWWAYGNGTLTLYNKSALLSYTVNPPPSTQIGTGEAGVVIVNPDINTSIPVMPTDGEIPLTPLQKVGKFMHWVFAPWIFGIPLFLFFLLLIIYLIYKYRENAKIAKKVKKRKEELNRRVTTPQPKDL